MFSNWSFLLWSLIPTRRPLFTDGVTGTRRISSPLETSPASGAHQQSRASPGPTPATFTTPATRGVRLSHTTLRSCLICRWIHLRSIRLILEALVRCPLDLSLPLLATKFPSNQPASIRLIVHALVRCSLSLSLSLFPTLGMQPP